MKLKSLYAAIGFGAVMLSSTLAIADPVYMIAQIQVEKQDKFFQQYSAAAYPSLVANEAKVLVATPTVQLLEGEWTGNWTVVIEFPSPEQADTWYKSDDYQKNAVPLRLDATEFGNLVFAPAFIYPEQ
ncbi:MAG: DUF1330 domain-containing protein [Hyphomicrobiales bacterium]